MGTAHPEGTQGNWRVHNPRGNLLRLPAHETMAPHCHGDRLFPGHPQDLEPAMVLPVLQHVR